VTLKIAADDCAGAANSGETMDEGGVVIAQRAIDYVEDAS
jgi:hypothetical protein